MLLLEHTFLHEAPFDSYRNQMTVVYGGRRLKAVLSLFFADTFPFPFTDTDESVALTKGSPSTLLSLCTEYYGADGVARIDQEIIQTIEKKAERMASSGLRVLALAYRPLDSQETLSIRRGEDAEEEQVFLRSCWFVRSSKVNLRFRKKKTNLTTYFFFSLSQTRSEGSHSSL